ncbi:protein of unknown function (plasmid) [Caballeronia sp. S22]
MDSAFDSPGAGRAEGTYRYMLESEAGNSATDIFPRVTGVTCLKLVLISRWFHASFDSRS